MKSSASRPRSRPEAPLYYPSDDDQPMSDSDPNMRRMIDAASALKEACRRRGVRAYVSHDLFVYPVEGKPWLCNSPDLLVAPGCDPGERLNFKYWEEPGVVEFAGEFLSVTDRRRRISDPETRRQVRFYREELRTRELFVYEPGGPGRRALAKFVFYRLEAGNYRAVAPGPEGWYKSEVLGLELQADDEGVWFRDPVTGEMFLPDRLARQEAEELVLTEQAARHEAEEVARAEQKARHQAEERARAEADARRAEADARRAAEAVAEDALRRLRELERRLGEGRGGGC